MTRGATDPEARQPDGWSRRAFIGAAAIATGLLTGVAAVGAKIGGLSWRSLQDRVKGAVTRRGDPDYELWRRAMVWQHRKPDRKPEFIVQAEFVEDVVQAVRYARAHGLKVTTRCGGHNMSACFLRDGGMLIDVSRLDGVRIDPAQKAAIAGPGVFGGGLLEKLREHDLVFPIAHASLVPLGGFLLGGGLGLNSNAWTHGRSAFAVLAADVVTAQGELVHASPTENQDLFWALRGGGPGFFGVVVKFYLQCFDNPPMVMSASYVLGLRNFRAAIRDIEANTDKLDPNLELSFAIGEAPPPLAERAKTDGGKVAYLSLIAFGDDEGACHKLLEPVAQMPAMAASWHREEAKPTSIEDILAAVDAGPLLPNCLWDNVLTDRPEDAATVILRHLPDCPAPGAVVSFHYTGGAPLPMPDAACSVTGRFYVAYYVNWSEPDLLPASRAFSAAVMQDLKPLGNGSYINEMNQEGRPKDIHSCYSPEAWRKLAVLRRKWDPDGVFHSFLGEA